jgi:hypothetical protein
MRREFDTVNLDAFCGQRERDAPGADRELERTAPPRTFRKKRRSCFLVATGAIIVVRGHVWAEA